MHYLLFIGLLLTSQITLASNLTIEVFEKGTGEPIVDATVVLENTAEFDETDNDGKVTLEDIELPD